MPTIYTFGDPDIVIEALLALATIFNAAEWSDGGAAFGLGGNLLAAALIGLFAILIAGLNNQTVRLDYLLTAFVLFAVVFSVKTDVNVEDVQTGAARIVADVPIGIAFVASASSSIAWSITETADLALQRPGSPTATISAGGFLNPLKTLIGIRNMSLDDLSGPVHRSLLEYYKSCVGKTMENNPGVFDMDDFVSDPDPLAYMFDTATPRVENYTTIYYSVAVPNGVAQGCHPTAAALDTDIGDLLAGGGDEMEQWIRRQLGTNQWDSNFSVADIDNAVDTLFRGGLTGAQFMEAQFVRNMHNAGEAWRTAEYGTDKAQYVATLTQAFEEQRISDAAKGSAFLQNMIPLMSFFQFLFFLLAPFVAFLAICVPQNSLKTVGFYLLLGVWAYSWMPIATVINHFIQIQMQNTLEFSDVVGVGTGFTAIQGFDSLYNQLATKVAIGSTALSWTPIIAGALLTLSVFGISQQAKSAGRAEAKTDITSPQLSKNGPIVQRAALASASAGTVLSNGGMFVAASAQQRDKWGQMNIGRKLSDVSSAARSSIESAQRSRSQAGSSLVRTVRGISNESEVGSYQRQTIREALNNQIDQRMQEIQGASQGQTLTNDEQAAIRAEAGAGVFRSGANATRGASTNLSSYGSKVLSQLKSEQSSLLAQSIMSLEEGSMREQETEASLRKDAGAVQELSEAISRNSALQEQVSNALSDLSGMGVEQNFDLAEIAELAGRTSTNPMSAHESILKSVGGESFASDMRAHAAVINESVSAAGLSGSFDPNDPVNQYASSLFALQQRAGSDPRAMEALLRSVQQVGGKAIGIDEKALDSISELNKMSGALDQKDTGSAFGASSRTGAAAGLSDGNISAQASEIGRTADSIDNAAGDFQNMDDTQAQMRAVAKNNRALDTAGYERAAGVVGAKMEGARSTMDDALTGKMMNYLRGDAGFNESTMPFLSSLPSGFGTNQAETNARVQAGAEAVARLEGAMAGQLGATDVRPSEVYSGLIESGMTPKLAAQGAYASAAYQRPGIADKLVYATIGGGVISKGAAMREASIISAAGDDPAKKRAAAKTFGARAARFAKVGGPAVAMLGLAGAYHMGNRKSEQNAQYADNQLKGDILEGIAQEGDLDAFMGHLRQNEMSAEGINSTQMINEYARFNNQALPLGNFAGINESDPAVVFQDVGALRDDLADKVK